MSEKKNKSLLLVGSLLLLFAAIVVVILILFLNGGETRTSEQQENESISALVCKSGNREDGFFEPKKALAVENEIKATFDQNGFEKLFYTYDGEYETDKDAEEDETRLHAAYNIYMGENSLSQSLFSPVYSLTKNKLRISLYTEERRSITLLTGKFFFVDDETVELFKKYKIDEMKKYYESKDFHCTISK